MFGDEMLTPVGHADFAYMRRRAGTSRFCSGHTKIPVGQDHMHVCGQGRAPRSAAVGTRERLPVAQVYVQVGGGTRAPRDSEVAARERLPMGR